MSKKAAVESCIDVLDDRTNWSLPGQVPAIPLGSLSASDPVVNADQQISPAAAHPGADPAVPFKFASEDQFVSGCVCTKSVVVEAWSRFLDNVVEAGPVRVEVAKPLISLWQVVREVFPGVQIAQLDDDWASTTFPHCVDQQRAILGNVPQVSGSGVVSAP